MSEFELEEIKKRAIADFKRRKEWYEDWVLKRRSAHRDKGLLEQLDKEEL